MTLIIETGAKVANSNSYVTISELTAYALARGITLIVDEEQLIIQSMEYIESLNFTGYKSESTQSLQWPRGDVYVDNYSIDIDSIPKLLKDALLATCLELEAGNNQLSTIDRETTQESVGSLSVTYKTGASAAPISRSISAQLRKLLSNGSGLYLVR